MRRLLFIQRLQEQLLNLIEKRQRRQEYRIIFDWYKGRKVSA